MPESISNKRRRVNHILADATTAIRKRAADGVPLHLGGSSGTNPEPVNQPHVTLDRGAPSKSMLVEVARSLIESEADNDFDIAEIRLRDVLNERAAAADAAGEPPL